MIHLSLVTLDAGELLNSSHEAIGGLEWIITLPNVEKPVTSAIRQKPSLPLLLANSSLTALMAGHIR